MEGRLSFHSRHIVVGIETIEQIARQYRYDNPGPILAYGPNHFAPFPVPSSVVRERVAPRAILFIPYRPEVLVKLIATAWKLSEEIARIANQLMLQQSGYDKKLEELLFLIDAANFVAGIGVNVGTVAVKGFIAVKDGKEILMTAEEAIEWIANSRISSAAEMMTNVTAPEKPRKGIGFWVRHSLGPWNPSFWTSVYASIREGNADIYLHGADAVSYDSKLRIQRQATADIAKLKKRVKEAEIQLNAQFYSYRC